MGGPETCTFMLTGSTSEEMLDSGWKHIQAEHPDMAKRIMENPKDVNDKWMAEFKERFDALPEA